MQIRSIQNDYQSSASSSVAFKKILRNDIPAKALKGNKYLLLVSGPSGVGKDTVMNLIKDKFNKIVTHTTREKRQGEIDGVSYFFTTVDKFLEGIKNNEFVEYVSSFSGKYYGTKKETIKKALDGEKPGLAIVDVDGVRNITKNLKNDPNINVVSVFFEPPSTEKFSPIDVLRKRLEGRKSETPKSLEERLARAEKEISCKGEYDAVIAFENPEEGVRDMKTLLNLK